MKEYDVVEVLVEKSKYAKKGVHKGMEGTILDPRNIFGQWLVFFENPRTFADDKDCEIDEKDLKVVYERIKTKDCTAELVVEDERYASLGVHKGNER